MKGANPKALEDLVVKHKPAGGMIGSGNVLGWSGVGAPPVTPVDPREARMKAFGALSTTSTAQSAKPSGS